GALLRRTAEGDCPHIEPLSAPALQVRPLAGPGVELLSLAEKDWNLLLQSPVIGGGPSHVLDLCPIALQDVFTVVEHDHAIARVVVGTPDPIGAIAAHDAGQPFATAEEVDGAGLPIVLREDAAVGALGRWNAVPCKRSL